MLEFKSLTNKYRVLSLSIFQLLKMHFIDISDVWTASTIIPVFLFSVNQWLYILAICQLVQNVHKLKHHS